MFFESLPLKPRQYQNPPGDAPSDSLIFAGQRAVDEKDIGGADKEAGQEAEEVGHEIRALARCAQKGQEGQAAGKGQPGLEALARAPVFVPELKCGEQPDGAENSGGGADGPMSRHLQGGVGKVSKGACQKDHEPADSRAGHPAHGGAEKGDACHIAKQMRNA